MIYAKKARDLARDDITSLGVSETDSLQTAIGKMVDYEEEIIPLLDNEGRILGDLQLSELLFKALELINQRKDLN
jgi:hypothetical protein